MGRPQRLSLLLSVLLSSPPPVVSISPLSSKYMKSKPRFKFFKDTLSFRMLHRLFAIRRLELIVTMVGSARSQGLSAGCAFRPTPTTYSEQGLVNAVLILRKIFS